MATPQLFVDFAAQGGLAADGRCKAFGAGADGTGWSEGAGVVVVERLSDALRRGHEVWAVVRGSAVNQDGASNGLTAPNGLAQQRVIRRALASAGLAPADVDAVEAHGTGTALGDPIEAGALLAIYGQDRGPEARPLWLGSVKSNIGHTQAAAGIAGVIKMVMALRHESLPRTLHADEPSPLVDWSSGAVELLTEPRPWPPTPDRPRRAGVSSFGISGTNAHLVLEEPPLVLPDEPPDEAPPTPPAPSPGPVPLVVSANGTDALVGQAARLAEQVRDGHDLRLVDVGFSLATGRAALEHRVVALAGDRDAALAQLDALAAGERAPGLVAGRVVPGGVGFLLSGQGAQRAGMGRGLHQRFPVFAAAFDEACALLDRELAGDLGRVGQASLRTLVLADRRGGKLPVDETVFAQAGLFALEVALVRLLGALGLGPEVVAGHSIGELAAAHVAGVFGLDDAARLVAARGRLMQALPAGGTMVALAGSEAEALELIAGGGRAGDAGDRVAVAAVNGPASVVVSGEKAAVDRLVRRWRARGRRARRLRVSHAFHSPLVEPMLDDFARVAATVDYRPPRLALVSTVTGGRVTGEMGTPGYWVDQVRRPVRFGDAVRALVAEGPATLLEVGPDAQLTTLVPDNLAAPGSPADVVAAPTLRPARDEAGTFVTAVAEAWVRGAPVDWAPLLPGARRVDLPTYAFQRRRYWPVAAPPALPSSDPDATVAGWRYGVVWKPLPAEDLAPVPTPGRRWLLVTTTGVDAGSAAWVERALTGAGGEVVPVPLADDAVDGVVAARLAEATAGGGPLDGVVSLAGLDETPDPTGTVTVGLAATLALIQALVDGDVTAPLWCLSQGAVATTDAEAEAIRAGQGQVWGLGRVVGLEHPDRWGGLVDLPGDLDEAAAAGLVAALAHAGGEDQLAVRSTGLLARRLARRALPAQASPWVTGGTALVTGGTGALGGQLARWLVDRGVEHVILASRRGAAAPGAGDLAAEVEQAGGRVTLAACDVTDPAALDRLLATVPTGQPLRTIVHCAGASVGGDLVDLAPAGLVEASAAKARGARLLHELADRHALDLDAFVLFSSGAAIWGGGGQGAYAAANAYVDALAERRRAAGLAATSVAWGPWAGDGMAEGETGDRLRRLGVREMAPELALRALGQALDAGDACVAVADLDWPRFAPSFAAARRRPLLEDLPEATLDRVPGADPVLGEHGGPGHVAGHGGAELDRRLAGLGRDERRQSLVELVREEVAAVLGHDGPAAVDPQRTFKDLGFDSVTAVELRNGLQALTGLRLPATLVFDHPNPGALGDELAARTAPEPRSPATDALRHLAEVEAALAGLGPSTGVEADPGDAEAVAQVRTALRRLLAGLSTSGSVSTNARRIEQRLLAADDDELLAFIDRELG